jgi:hypothetical protein
LRHRVDAIFTTRPVCFSYAAAAADPGSTAPALSTATSPLPTLARAIAGDESRIARLFFMRCSSSRNTQEIADFRLQIEFQIGERQTRPF